MDKTDQKEFYNEIVKLYDLAESVIDVLEYGNIKEPDLHVDLCMPLIEQMQETTGIVSDKFIKYLENGEEMPSKDAREVEAAIRKVYTQVEELTDKLAERKG